jgi:drug/metabolite transporter superfamily protein YnfA
MAPKIVLAGAGAGIVSLLCVFVVFLLQLPAALAALLYLVFGGLFVASAVIFGRLLVMDT